MTYNCCNDCHADEAHYSVQSPPPLCFEEYPLFVPLETGIARSVLVESSLEVILAVCCVGKSFFRLDSVTRVSRRERQDGSEQPEERKKEAERKEQDLPVSAAAEKGVKGLDKAG